MIFTGTIVLGVAGIARAFLLPPTVSSIDTDIINTLPSEAEFLLELECTKCPVATWPPSSPKRVWVQGVESKLQLHFSIQHNNVDALYLNSLQLYPAPDFSMSEPLDAFQVAADQDINESAYLRLGYELSINPIVNSKEDQLELINVHLQIVEIADKFVDGLQSVELKLVKTADGKLMIGKVEIAPTTNPGGKDCNTLVCQLRKIITDKMSHIKPTKGCGGKIGHHKSRPTIGHNPHHHHHHHKHHGFGRLLHAIKSIAFHVLVPVFVGVIAGFTASLIGLIVGQTIVFLWRRFYRHGQKGSHSKLQQYETVDKIADATEDESKTFLEHQDPPPMYENIVENEKSTE